MSIIYIRDHDECIYNLPHLPSGVRISEFSPAAKKFHFTKRRGQKRQNTVEVPPEAPPQKRKPAVPRRSIIKEQDDKLKHEPVSESKLWKVAAAKPKVARKPSITNTKTFGKLPKYMQERVKEKGNAQHLKKHPQEPQPKCRYIIRDCRNKLLEGLKENWEEMQAQYQKLSIFTDTIPKKNIKAQLEANMKQLERDIVLVERHPYIYVYPDDVLQ